MWTSLRTVFKQFEARGVHFPWASYDQLLAPQVSYLLLGCMVINRQTSNAVHEREETLICADEVRHGAFLHHTAIGYSYRYRSAPHYQSALRGGCCLGGGGGGATPCSPSFGLGITPPKLRTHKLMVGHARPLRSAVVDYQASSVAAGHQLCARTGRVSGHSRHPVIARSTPTHRLYSLHKIHIFT